MLNDFRSIEAICNDLVTDLEQYTEDVNMEFSGMARLVTVLLTLYPNSK